MSDISILGDYSVGDSVLILGSKGVVVGIDEKESMLVINSSRGISKVSPFVSSFTLQKINSVEIQSQETIKEQTIDSSAEEIEIKEKQLQKDNKENESVSSSPTISTTCDVLSDIISINRQQCIISENNQGAIVSNDEDSSFFFAKWDFPVDFEYGENSFSGIPSKETLLEIMNGLGYKKIKIKIDKPKEFRPRYKREFGTQFLFDARFDIYGNMGLVVIVTARTPLDVNAIDAKSFSIHSDTLSWSNDNNQYTRTKEHKGYRSQDYIDVFQFPFFYIEHCFEYQDIFGLYSVLNSKKVKIKLGSIDIPLEQDHVDFLKKNIIVYGAIEETLIEYYENQYEDQKNSWINAKGFNSDANERFLRSKDLKEFYVNKATKEATFIGHTGEQYSTTLTSCTCKDFLERDSEKREFIPCKHMFKLASKLGYFQGLSRLPIDRNGNQFLTSLDYYSPEDYSSGFSTDKCSPWKKPLIVLDPKVRWTSLKTGLTGNIELYLGFQNIFFDPTEEMDFDDIDHLKCRIEGDFEKPQDVYNDVQGTMHYRITQYPTMDIYLKLLSGESFDVEFFIYGEDKPSYLFSFPATKGFGGFYLKNYHILLNGK